MQQFVCGFECDYVDPDTVELNAGSWVPAGRDMEPLSTSGRQLRYPDDVHGPTGPGWYRVYVFNDWSACLAKTERYTADLVQGRLSRKLPLVLYRNAIGFVPWQTHGEDTFWTAFNPNQSYYMLSNPSGVVTLPMMPEESRLAHLYVQTTGTCTLRTPGVAAGLPLWAGTHTAELITNSQQQIEVTCASSLLLGVRGWRFRGPI